MVETGITSGFPARKVRVSMLGWSVDRPFFFTENDLSFKRVFSLYHSMQIDRPTANPGSPAINFGVGQSLLSFRIQATHDRVRAQDTYFRDVPTYDASLVGTGLLDRYLFQGVSGGSRIQLPHRITGYFSVGPKQRLDGQEVVLEHDVRCVDVPYLEDGTNGRCPLLKVRQFICVGRLSHRVDIPRPWRPVPRLSFQGGNNRTLPLYRKIRAITLRTFWWIPILDRDTFWRVVIRRSEAARTSTTSSRPPSAIVSITAPAKGWLPMRRNPSALCIGLGLAVLVQSMSAQSVVPVNLVDQAQKQVVAYVLKARRPALHGRRASGEAEA